VLVTLVVETLEEADAQMSVFSSLKLRTRSLMRPNSLPIRFVRGVTCKGKFIFGLLEMNLSSCKGARISYHPSINNTTNRRVCMRKTVR
jgi:hypothetical protein